MTHYQLEPDESQVWIDGSSSVHPIRATALGLTGWFDLATTKSGIAAAPQLAGEVRISVDRLQSGNPLVDRETRRRVDAKRYPEIIGAVTSSTRLEPNRLRLSGDITFRGETQPVTGEVTMSVDGDSVTVDGEARFDVRAWGLEPPRVALLRVHPEVGVRIHLVARSTT